MRRIFKALVYLFILAVIIGSLFAYRSDPDSGYLYDYKVSVLEPLLKYIRPLPNQRDWYVVMLLEHRGGELADSFETGAMDTATQDRFVIAYREAVSRVNTRVNDLNNGGKPLAAHELAATANALTGLHEQLANQLGSQKKTPLSEGTLRAIRAENTKTYDSLRNIESALAPKLQSQEFASRADDAINEATVSLNDAISQFDRADKMHQLSRRSLQELIDLSQQWLDQSKNDRNADLFISSVRAASFAKAGSVACQQWIGIAQKYQDSQIIFQFPWVVTKVSNK